MVIAEVIELIIMIEETKLIMMCGEIIIKLEHSQHQCRISTYSPPTKLSSNSISS